MPSPRKTASNVYRRMADLLNLNSHKPSSTKPPPPITPLPHTSSFSNIPDELISRILLNVLDHPRPLDSSGRQTFLQLRHISKRWRDIAFATPEAWRCLHVEVARSNWRLQLEYIEAWFARGGDPSGPYALVMTSTEELRPDDQTEPLLRAMLWRYGWEELGLCSHSLLCMVKPHSSSRLKRLTLHYDVNDLDGKGAPLLHSPIALESVHYHSFYFSIPSPSFDQHRSITSIHITSAPFRSNTQWGMYLSEGSLPSLEEIIIDNCRGKPSYQLASKLTNHTQHRTNRTVTRLIILGPKSLRALTKACIYFPSLRSLHVEAIGTRASPRIMGLSPGTAQWSFLSRSTEKLEMISLEKFYLDAQSLGRLLKLVSHSSQSLHTLHIPSFNAFSNLAHDARFPKLSTIVVLNPDVGGFSSLLTHFENERKAIPNRETVTIIAQEGTNTLFDDHVRSLVDSWSGIKSEAFKSVAEGVVVCQMNRAIYPGLQYPIRGHGYRPSRHRDVMEDYDSDTDSSDDSEEEDGHPVLLICALGPLPLIQPGSSTSAIISM